MNLVKKIISADDKKTMSYINQHLKNEDNIATIINSEMMHVLCVCRMSFLMHMNNFFKRFMLLHVLGTLKHLVLNMRTFSMLCN